MVMETLVDSKALVIQKSSVDKRWEIGIGVARSLALGDPVGVGRSLSHPKTCRRFEPLGRHLVVLTIQRA